MSIKIETYAAPTHVYRLYSEAGALLYVGIASDLDRRIGQHRYEKPWFWQVARIEYETFDGRSAAKGAESLLIRTEKPIYNLAENDGPPWDDPHALHCPLCFRLTRPWDDIPDYHSQTWLSAYRCKHDGRTWTAPWDYPYGDPLDDFDYRPGGDY